MHMRFFKIEGSKFDGVNFYEESVCMYSVIKSWLTLCNPMNTRIPCPSPSPGVCSNSCPLSQWCHWTISSLLLASSLPNLKIVQGLWNSKCKIWQSRMILKGSDLISFVWLHFDIIQRIDPFELWHWRRLLKAPWTARRSIQSVLKEINPEYWLEGLVLKLKLQYFCHLMRKTDWHWKWPDAEKDGGQEERGATEDKMVECHHWLNVHEFEQTPEDSEGLRSLVCCSPEVAKSQTRLSNWTTIFTYHISILKGSSYQSIFRIIKDFFFPKSLLNWNLKCKPVKVTMV